MELGTESSAFAQMSHATQTLCNPTLQSWKGQGGKVVGYFCSFMPLELITAAGLLPFRIRGTGSTSTELADAYLSNLNCSFSKHCFNLALAGEYDWLDGLVMFNSCDALRRTYDYWVRRVDTPFVKLLHLPKKTDAPQVAFFREQLADLRTQLEREFDVEISDTRLREAIGLHNETRRLLRQLYQLRRVKVPPITGSEVLAVTVASTAMPGQEFNALLRTLLKEIESRQATKAYRARLMIIGCELDDPRYLEVIEGLGGLVVGDSLCYGSRTLWHSVDEAAEDPLGALASYYLAGRPSCPRICTQYESRDTYVMKMIRDFQVDGVILERITFCDTWAFEGYSLEHDFKDRKIPLLVLEREYNHLGEGQLRTRVQAFLESMEG